MLTFTLKVILYLYWSAHTSNRFYWSSNKMIVWNVGWGIMICSAVPLSGPRSEDFILWIQPTPHHGGEFLGDNLRSLMSKGLSAVFGHLPELLGLTTSNLVQHPLVGYRTQPILKRPPWIWGRRCKERISFSLVCPLTRSVGWCV